MKIYCKELNKEFDSKALMFAELKASKDAIIGLKKAAEKLSDPIRFIAKVDEATKADNGSDNSTVGIGSIIYPVINTTCLLDSHGDVHIDGIWDLSIKDQKGKLYYAINHELKIGSIIAYPQDVEAYVETLEWSKIGKDYPGTTQALIYKVTLTDASNKDALNAIVTKKPLQNSVRMRYVSMTLCIDDAGDDFKTEQANFYKYLALIVNKQDALDAGYFWAITEAAIYKEGSAVLEGSNFETPILYSDPGSTSQKQQEESPTDVSKSLELINSFKFLN